MRGRGRRHQGPRRVDPNLTPLLDVVLQLITFFMMLVHFGTRIEGATKSVRLPTAPAALPGADLGLDRILAVIDASGRLQLDDDTYDPADTGPWAALASQRREGLRTIGTSPAELPTVVVLRADEAVTYGAVRSVLTAAEAAGFVHFTLVVHHEPEGAP